MIGITVIGITVIGITVIGITVIGITVSRPGAEQADKVWSLTQATAELAAVDLTVGREDVHCDDSHYAPGYGRPNAAMGEALTLTARSEGLILDPVYSGKVMAGLIAMIRDGRFDRHETVVFLHTGGAAGLFGYRSLFSAS